jgi:hypothetical protein
MCAAAGGSHHHQQHKQQQLDHIEDSIIWAEARATMAARAALTAEMQARPSLSTFIFKYFQHSYSKAEIFIACFFTNVTLCSQLVLSVDSVTGSPLSQSEWSLLNSQTSNSPSKFGAILFIPCLLGVLPPTTATVFHHGTSNDARATRVVILSPPASSSSRAPPGMAHHHAALNLPLDVLCLCTARDWSCPCRLVSCSCGRLLHHARSGRCGSKTGEFRERLGIMSGSCTE